jgi:predicted RNA binding protein YcfA (HicA-like mRNA interferase family)
MPTLYSSARITAVLQRNGFRYVSQRGSHVKFRRRDGSVVLTVIVPAGRKEIPHGTFRSILKQSSLEEGDFAKP